jgi:hypothetical protein
MVASLNVKSGVGWKSSTWTPLKTKSEYAFADYVSDPYL